MIGTFFEGVGANDDKSCGTCTEGVVNSAVRPPLEHDFERYVRDDKNWLNTTSSFSTLCRTDLILRDHDVLVLGGAS